MPLLKVAAFYAGLNILILLVLALLVVGGRRRHKIKLGDGDNEAFTRAIRAHANATEYIPAALVGLLIMALLVPPAAQSNAWGVLLHAGGASLTLGRIFHGLGLHAGTLNAGRVLGTLLTFVSYLLIGGGLLYAVLAWPA